MRYNAKNVIKICFRYNCQKMVMKRTFTTPNMMMTSIALTAIYR